MTRSTTEQRLSDGLARLAEFAATAPRDQPVPTELIPTAPRREHRRIELVAAAVVVILVAGAVAFAARPKSHAPVGRTNPPAPTPSTLGNSLSDLLAPGATRDLPPAPIADRADFSAVWDGTEMLVWGGDSVSDAPAGTIPKTFADGAAYNPRTNAWRVLPPAPIGARTTANAVWTGSEMVIWGGADAVDSEHAFDDGAAYDPTTNSWRVIAAAPIEAAMGAETIWTGSEMIVVGGLTPQTPDQQQIAHQFGITDPGVSDVDREAAAYDPSTDTWRRLPDAPGVTPPFPQAVWAGNEAVFLIGNSLAAYDPASNQWTTLTSFSSTGAGRLVWTGTELLNLAGSAADIDNAGVFDLETHTWSRTVSAPPAFGGYLSDSPVWTGTQAIYAPGGNIGGAYTRATDSWHDDNAGALPERGGGAAVWANGVMITWGGFDAHPSPTDPDGLLYRPAT